MVMKESKLGPPKIYWAQVPGNKCVEFIIVHFQRILAGCGRHVTWGSLGLAAQNHLRKLIFFQWPSVWYMCQMVRGLVFLERFLLSSLARTEGRVSYTGSHRACWEGMVSPQLVCETGSFPRHWSTLCFYSVILLQSFPWLAETDGYLIQGVRRC